MIVVFDKLVLPHAEAPGLNLRMIKFMNVGIAIEECRKLKGITKSSLASQAGVSLPYLSQIINGQREPSITTIDKISSSLGIPSSLLVFLASDDSELISVSSELRDQIRNVAKSLIKESSDTFISTQVFGN
ncbi:helix-turn-helix domain-containing protein [Oceanobacter kriegii]|uniref:helix-turn-helix domain-containing protein n=1 Tax=Oceanobacter kriegii TaxID=64972 RepID=UPI000685132D